MKRENAVALRSEITDFMSLEAELVDTRRFEEWLGLFSEDLHYRMPMARNLAHQGIRAGVEYLSEPLDVSWFDEGKETLKTRVAQIRTGVHWAEEPLSRTAHLVTNIRIVDIDGLPDDPTEIQVNSKFLVYRNRNADEEDTLIGRREDHLRRVGGSWEIFRRTVYICQTVLLARNLSFLV
ncbi:3-phenylpropionate/cinnamic acid dioxygenase small subunit [Aminobacter lissarensis]|uniref:3-phenylpropionate/cinnamic acid dioxygenase small subunit n=1 Tax=Aminobacter carboxidus TaxID=376165 RepID=A0A8E1WCT7_9HYPH|nr:3-phenylpropionate/cinnamic acid dioxygenase subunit beta [Aminobacter lissarensis]MBB6465629.1 3-phenylpropionate/cinnamic acid dioxygenase small subunit [Aminobacter lissarensis]